MRLDQPDFHMMSIRKEVGSCTLTRSTLVHSPNWSAAARLFYLRGWEGGTRTEGPADKRIHAGVEARIYGRSQVPGTGSWLVGWQPRITITCFRRGASSSPARSLPPFPLSLLFFSYSRFRRFVGNETAPIQKSLQSWDFRFQCACVCVCYIIYNNGYRL